MKKWKIGFLLLFLFYVSLLTVPYLSHKKISSTWKEEFQNKEFYSDTLGTERVAYIDDNMEALLSRFHMIQSAKESIILSTFDFNADESGKDVMACLYAAADRGVQVQILADGISGTMDIMPGSWFQALASHENISVKIYNPVNLLTPWKLQARLHDKYLIIDDSMYLLGGRNTYDLFLGNYSEKKNIDRELFVYETEPEADASLYQLRHYFEAVWELPDSKEFF